MQSLKLVSLGAMLVMAASLSMAQNDSNGLTVAGVWRVRVTPEVPPGAPVPTLFEVAMYSKDGSFTSSADTALPPIPPVQAIGTQRGVAVGNYIRVGGREFRLTFYAPILNNGSVTGFMKVTDTIVLTADGNEYDGHALVEFLYADLSVGFVTSGRAHGSRLPTPEHP